MTSSINKTGAFEELWILILLTIIPASSKSHGLGHNILQKTYWVLFFYAKQLVQSSTWTFCVNLWWYRMSRRTVGTPCGTCKMVSVCIEQLKSSISCTNISMIMLLLWIIQSIREATLICLPIHQIWLLVTFFCGEGGGGELR